MPSQAKEELKFEYGGDQSIGKGLYAGVSCSSARVSGVGVSCSSAGVSGVGVSCFSARVSSVDVFCSSARVSGVGVSCSPAGVSISTALQLADVYHELQGGYLLESVTWSLNHVQAPAAQRSRMQVTRRKSCTRAEYFCHYVFCQHTPVHMILAQVNECKASPVQLVLDIILKLNNNSCIIR